MNLILQILKELDRTIENENDQRKSDDQARLLKSEILLLGQMGLFAHPTHLETKLHLVGTVDVDALFQSEWVVRKMFVEILSKHGLEYDEDSEKIWIPPESTRTKILDTARLKCDVLDPIYVLTSKAIKAKEKNRHLIKQALSIFGTPLESLIQKYGGDLNFFREK